MSSREELAPDRALVEIERDEHDGVRVVAVAGELDISNVAALEDATFDLPNEALGMVLDLTATTFIDSATIGLLFDLDRALGRRGQPLRVVCSPRAPARRVLDLMSFDPDALTEEDSAAAIAAIRRAAPLRG
jgi:anti-anti-sigma factor